jgi:hypothetical protein
MSRASWLVVAHLIFASVMIAFEGRPRLEVTGSEAAPSMQKEGCEICLHGDDMGCVRLPPRLCP